MLYKHLDNTHTHTHMHCSFVSCSVGIGVALAHLLAEGVQPCTHLEETVMDGLPSSVAVRLVRENHQPTHSAVALQRTPPPGWS
jgi:hypothetical protein